MQRAVHILGHVAGVAAHIQVAACCKGNVAGQECEHGRAAAEACKQQPQLCRACPAAPGRHFGCLRPPASPHPQTPHHAPHLPTTACLPDSHSRPHISAACASMWCCTYSFCDLSRENATCSCRGWAGGQTAGGDGLVSAEQPRMARADSKHGRQARGGCGCSRTVCCCRRRRPAKAPFGHRQAGACCAPVREHHLPLPLPALPHK